MKNAIRKLGIVGFAFFFVKGMLWLTVPAAIVAFRGCGAETPPPASAAVHEAGVAILEAGAKP